MATSPESGRPYGEAGRGASDGFLRLYYERVRDRLHDRETRPITIALLGAVGLLVVGLVYWLVLLAQLPSAEDLRRSRFEQATIVYTADGEELTRYQDKNRTWVSLDSISSNVVDALVAVEDRRFYDHPGVDVRRTFGSIFETLGGDVQGGSTITMQLARNAFQGISDDMILTRKIKEWITALRIEQMYEKDDILEMYLNTVPFMYNAFGIEAAARTYYQKPAIELDVLESATLVGMLKGTVYYNPVRNPERSHERRNIVLQLMVEQGKLEADRYEELKAQETELDFRRLTHSDNLAPYFAEHLRQWLDEWAEERGYNLYTSGLRVYTTLDSRLQAAATEAAERMGERLQAVADVEWSRSSVPHFSTNAGSYLQYRRNVDAFDYFWRSRSNVRDAFLMRTARFRSALEQGTDSTAALEMLLGDPVFVDSVLADRQRLEVGFVAMDPRNGHVRAWVGGRDFEETQFDHVAQSRRQPGSTFKPFVYAAALSYGYRPTDRKRDEVIEYVDPDTRRRWRPTNVGSASGELVTLKDALAYSKNTVTAQLVDEIGPQRVAEFAHRMGIRSKLAAVPSIGLGTSEVTLLEMATAYSTLADRGTYHEPVLVTRIEDNSGRLLARFSERSESAISAVTAYEVLDMMRGVVDYGTGQRIRHEFGARGDLAAKTGTTQNGADGWFMLLHPELVVGSWVGFTTPALHFRSDYWGQGSHNALKVVGHFYRKVRQDVPEILADRAFTPPPGYTPPAPRPGPDTSYYAFTTGSDTARYDGSRYDEAYFDSLDAVTDSLLRGDDDRRWREPEDEAESTPFADPDSFRLDRNRFREPADDVAEDVGEEAGEEAEREEPDEPMTAADSLNRRELRKSTVDPQNVPKQGRQQKKNGSRGNRGAQKKDTTGTGNR